MHGAYATTTLCALYGACAVFTDPGCYTTEPVQWTTRHRPGGIGQFCLGLFILWIIVQISICHWPFDVFLQSFNSELCALVSAFVWNLLPNTQHTSLPIIMSISLNGFDSFWDKQMHYMNTFHRPNMQRTLLYTLHEDLSLNNETPKDMDGICHAI